MLDALKTKGISIRWVPFIQHMHLLCVRGWVAFVWRCGCVWGGYTLNQDVIAPPQPAHNLAPFLPQNDSVASPKLVMEEAPESYKDVTAVVDTCHAAGISKKAVRLRPIGVVKG